MGWAVPSQSQDGPLRPKFLEHRRRVIGYRILAGLRHAMSLFRQDVKEDGAILVLHIAQPAAQGGQIVAVYGPDVAEAHLFEKHAARERSLQPVPDLVQSLGGHGADQRQTAE